MYYVIMKECYYVIINVIMKDGWIQNDERRVLMDDRLLGHRAFSDLSFAQKRIFSHFQIYLLLKKEYSHFFRFIFCPKKNILTI